MTTRYVIKPDLNELAKRSQEFFVAEARRSEADVDSARSRLDDAEATYATADNPGWKEENVLAKAEDNFERAERIHTANLLKLNWEGSRQWKRKIVASLQFTKALLAGIDWKHIFKGRPGTPL